MRKQAWWLDVGLIGLLAVVVWLLRSRFHAMPLERDEGAYAVIARDWLRGLVPYRDLFDHKPPFVYLAYMPSQFLPGDSVVAIRIWSTIWAFLTCLAMWWVSHRLWRKRYAAMITAGVTAVWMTTTFVQGVTFNAEAVMLLPATAYLGAVLTGLQHPHRRWWLLAGGLAAATLFSKQIGVILLAVGIIGAVLSRERWRSLAAFAGGLALIIVPVVGYFALTGSFKWFWTAQITYNLKYASQSLDQNVGWLIWPIWQPLMILVIAALAGGFASSWHQRQIAHTSELAVTWRQAQRWVTLVWSSLLIIGAILSHRAYPHYYLVVIPALAVWIGGLLLGGFNNVATWVWFTMRVGLIAFILAHPIRFIRQHAAKTPDAQVEQLYGGDGTNFFNQADEVVAWIKQRYPPGTRVWVWAAEPEIYYLGRFVVPTRYPYDYPLAGLPGARDEVLQTLRTNPPRVIVTYQGVMPMGIGEIQALHNYQFGAVVGGYTLWVLP